MLIVGCFLLGSTPAFAQTSTAPPRRILRVAADPNNLPFSNQRGEGFENKIAELIARDLNADLVYTWRAQRRGFFRETLKNGDCDFATGIPAQSEMALTTKPYYRSSYALVYRPDKNLEMHSLDDPALRRLKIGIELAGDTAGNTPPAHALAGRGIITNVTGFSVFGDYATANPPARIIDAVARGDIDVAIVWGPLAGYFAKRQRVPLAVVALSPDKDSSGQPFAFEISLGVKRGNERLRDELNDVLARRRDEIERILDTYGVPRVAAEQRTANLP